MSTSPAQITPPPGRLPIAFSLAMLHILVRGLVFPGMPAAHARQLIQDALGMVDDYAPRDALEAMLVLQAVGFHSRAQQALIRASAERDPGKLVRAERHAMALGRSASSLQRQLWQHRKALAAEGVVRTVEAHWDYDLDALAALCAEGRTAAADAPAAAVEDMVEPAEGTDAGSVAPAVPAVAPSRQMRRALERKERKQQMRAERAAALLQRLARVA